MFYNLRWRLQRFGVSPARRRCSLWWITNRCGERDMAENAWNPVNAWRRAPGKIDHVDCEFQCRPAHCGITAKLFCFLKRNPSFFRELVYLMVDGYLKEKSGILLINKLVKWCQVFLAQWWVSVDLQIAQFEIVDRKIHLVETSIHPFSVTTYPPLRVAGMLEPIPANLGPRQGTGKFV